MSESEEIEVEVVEVVDHEPASRSGKEPSSNSERPASRAKDKQRNPFGGMPARPLRIPGYLWPLVVVFGLIFLLLAVLVLILVVIPFLILRAILRLLLPSR